MLIWKRKSENWALPRVGNITTFYFKGSVSSEAVANVKHISVSEFEDTYEVIEIPDELVKDCPLNPYYCVDLVIGKDPIDFRKLQKGNENRT